VNKFKDDFFLNPFVDEGSIKVLLMPSLNTVGLLSYEDGKAKPAWTEFLKWISVFQ